MSGKHLPEGGIQLKVTVHPLQHIRVLQNFFYGHMEAKTHQLLHQLIVADLVIPVASQTGAGIHQEGQ
ncbi:hypothetical protein D3C71_1934490 [compost metagenome]